MLIKKIIYSIIALFIGTIIFGIVKDMVGTGHHIIAGLIVLALWKIWTLKPAEE